MSTHDEHNDVTISIGKYRWWIQPMLVGSLVVPRIGVLISLLARLPRPGCPGESLLAGYFKLMKFRGGEQDLLVETLLSLDATYFDGIPTRNMAPPDRTGQKRACAEATLAFLGRRNGFQTNGTPAATPGPSYDAVMEAAITRALAQATVRPRPEPEPEANCTGRIR